MMITVVSLFLATGSAHAAPGFRFHEPMKGTTVIEGKKVSARISLTAEIADIDAWSKSPEHAAAVNGTATLGPIRSRVSGTLELMVKNPPGEAPGYYLRYDLQTLPGESLAYELKCEKHVKNGPSLNLIGEVTVCRGELARYENPESGEVLTHLPLTLRFHWENPITTVGFLASFRAEGAHGVGQDAHVFGKFLGLWFGGLWDALTSKPSGIRR